MVATWRAPRRLRSSCLSPSPPPPPPKPSPSSPASRRRPRSFFVLLLPAPERERKELLSLHSSGGRKVAWDLVVMTAKLRKINYLLRRTFLLRLLRNGTHLERIRFWIKFNVNEMTIPRLAVNRIYPHWHTHAHHVVPLSHFELEAPSSTSSSSCLFLSRWTGIYMHGRSRSTEEKAVSQKERKMGKKERKEKLTLIFLHFLQKWIGFLFVLLLHTLFTRWIINISLDPKRPQTVDRANAVRVIMNEVLSLEVAACSTPLSMHGDKGQ